MVVSTGRRYNVGGRQVKCKQSRSLHGAIKVPDNHVSGRDRNRRDGRYELGQRGSGLGYVVGAKVAGVNIQTLR